MCARYCAERKKPVEKEYRRCDSTYIKFQKMKLNLQWPNADWKLVRGKSGCRNELRRGIRKLLGVLDLFVVLVVVYTHVKMDKSLCFKQFITLHFSFIKLHFKYLLLSFIYTFKILFKDMWLFLHVVMKSFIGYIKWKDNIKSTYNMPLFKKLKDIPTYPYFAYI